MVRIVYTSMVLLMLDIILLVLAMLVTILSSVKFVKDKTFIST